MTAKKTIRERRLAMTVDGYPMTREELAVFLHVSISTVARWESENHINKKSSRRYFEDLEARFRAQGSLSLNLPQLPQENPPAKPGGRG